MEKAEIENENQSQDVQSIDEDQAVDNYLQQINQSNFLQYLQTAKQMKKEEDFVEAMYLFRALIEKGTEIYNSELNINLSNIYFNLGDCILLKLEQEQDELFGGEDALKEYQQQNGIEQFIDENGQLDKEAFQQNLMQNVIQKIQSNQQIIQQGQQVQEKRKSMKEEQKEQNQVKDCQSQCCQIQENQEQNNQENQDDDLLTEIQLAWENIETARVILVKYLDEQNNLKQEDKKQFLKQLADYVLRLGDIENKKEQFDKALEEYQNSLQLLQLIEDQQRSRRIAEVQFLIGNSYLYREKDNYLKDALDSFQQGYDIINTLVKEQNDKEKQKELKELLKVFQEKIFDIEDEIQVIESFNQQKESLQKKEATPFGQSQFNQKPQQLGTFNNQDNTSSTSKNKKIFEQIKNQQIV